MKLRLGKLLFKQTQSIPYHFKFPALWFILQQGPVGPRWQQGALEENGTPIIVGRLLFPPSLLIRLPCRTTPTPHSSTPLPSLATSSLIFSTFIWSPQIQVEIQISFGQENRIKLLFWYIIFKKKQRPSNEWIILVFPSELGRGRWQQLWKSDLQDARGDRKRGVQAPGRKATLSFSLDSLAAQWGALHWKLVTRGTPFHLRHTPISFFAAINSLICSWNTHWAVYDIGGHTLGTWVTKINKMR